MGQRAVNGQGTSLLARRPEIIPITATVLAWLALLIDSPAVAWSTVGGPAGAHDGHGGVFTVSGAAMVGTMTIAMMGPLAVPGMRAVAARLLTRPGWTLGWFFVAFMLTWTVIALILAPVAETFAGVLGSPVIAAGILALLCAVAQFDPRRRDALRAGGRPSGLQRNGSGAIVNSARFGMSHATGGFRTCALPMLAMFALPASLPFMAVLTVLVVADQATAGRHRVVVAALYAILGAGLLGAGLLS